MQPGELAAPPMPTELNETSDSVPEVTVAGNRLRVFAESAPLLASMAEDLRQAQSRAWVESYTIAADAAGRAIAAALKERAAAGVDCRVMYDAVGSYDTPSEFFADMQRAGVQVHGYRSLWDVVWKFASLQPFNRRNHRKLTVIDDRVAYFGGMNIIDQSGIESVADAKARRLPASAGWRDVHVRLEGPRQPEVAAAFERLWQRVHLHQRVRWPRWKVAEMLDCQGEGLYFFDSRPLKKNFRPDKVLVPLIRQARRSITLSMAYFIPVGNVLRELMRARRRGVTVRVIVPGESDVRLAQWASRHMYERLLRRGFRIYERRDQMLHSKTLVIDGVWSIIGSCNMDPRSLLLNLEFMAAIRSQEMAATVERISRYELRNSQPVAMVHCHRRPWWQRQLDRAAWTMRRWL